MDLSQVVNNLNTILEELVELSKESNILEPKENFEEEIIRIAKLNPIKNHILCEKDEIIQNIYITSLMSIFSQETNETIRKQQLLMIGRIISSFKPDFNFKEYIAKSLKVDKKFWDKFIELMGDGVAVNFAVDVLIISQLTKERTSEKLFFSIADILQFLKLDVSMIKKSVIIAKSILMQDFNTMLEVIKPDDGVEYNFFLGYFLDAHYTHVVSNIFASKNVTGKLLVVNAKINNIEEIIDMDEFAAEEIKFLRCEFLHIRGIRSLSKNIEFDECVFHSNLFNVTEETNFMDRINDMIMDIAMDRCHKEYEEDYPFFCGCNVRFIKSKFINCKVSKNLLYVENGYIEDCTFVECEGKDLPRTYLIHIKTGDVRGTTFKKCNVQTKTSLDYTFGGIVCIENGTMKKCTFEECESYGNSSYGTYAKYHMQILRTINSKVINCKFDRCCCSSCNSSNKTVTSYILGMTDSKEEANEFLECSSYHYRYSDIGSTYNIGEI